MNTMRPSARGLALLFIGFIWLLGPVSPLQAATHVGEVMFMAGAATAQAKSGEIRLAGKGMKFQQGDVLTTARRSYVIIKLRDGTKMTLRPNTVFKVEGYSEGEREEENSMVLRLFRGGLRALTGFISKRNPNGYKLHTNMATIGIRGTEFDVRLCAADCAKEHQESGKERPARNLSRPAGRVAFIHGNMQAEIQGEGKRRLKAGYPVHEGEVLQTGSGSFGVVLFRDRGRVVLQAESRLQVERFRYEPEEPEQGSMIMRLLRGGMRTVTGIVGKRNRTAYKVYTPVASIGIRGTGFDLHCQGDCVGDEVATRSVRGELTTPLRGMFASVWDGAIDLELPSGALRMDVGQTLFLAHSGAKPVYLLQPPSFMLQVPRPTEVEIDEEKLLGRELDRRGDIPPGLYLNVYAGEVEMGDMVFGPGDSGRALPSGPVERLNSSPYLEPYPDITQGDPPPNYRDTGAACEVP
jgi:hypothetical protein